ncbi:hypothetical protein QZH41_010006 [Actinostola sp. cb2023]|nr:hypothetical protein QZH41_010006 [Actinostola sp. cb2023]
MNPYLTNFPTSIKTEAKVKLLADYEVFVDRDKLRSILHASNSKGPLHLLGRLVALAYCQDELAQSCGQGLHNCKTASGGDKPPLNAEKLSACKEYMTAFCIQHGKTIPSPKEINMTITAQVTYARVKVNGRKK